MQEREPIWDNRTGKGFLTDFRTDCHRKRQPQKQNCKRRKKRMTHPLGDTHPAQLLPGQANRAQDTVLPLPGHLVGKRRIDQIDSAKQEDSQERACRLPNIMPLCIFSYSICAAMLSIPRLLRPDTSSFIPQSCRPQSLRSDQIAPVSNRQVSDTNICSSCRSSSTFLRFSMQVHKPWPTARSVVQVAPKIYICKPQKNSPLRNPNTSPHNTAVFPPNRRTLFRSAHHVTVLHLSSFFILQPDAPAAGAAACQFIIYFHCHIAAHRKPESCVYQI